MEILNKKLFLPSFSFGILSSFKRSFFWFHDAFRGNKPDTFFEILNYQSLILSVFSLTSSHHHLPSFVPLGHLLYHGSEQQEVTDYSDQPSLSCSTADIHLPVLLQTEDMWRQKNCILSQDEYCQHASHRIGSSWNPHYLEDKS